MGIWFFQFSVVAIASVLIFHIVNVQSQYPARSNNTELVYALRNKKYFSKPIETKLVSDACIRSLAVQKLMGLKLFIKVLTSQNKEPSDETIQKLQILRKISFTSNYSLISDLSDVKPIMEDIKANINRLYKSSGQQTQVGSIETVDENSQQTETREEHMELKQLQLDHEQIKTDKSQTDEYTKTDYGREDQTETANSEKITSDTTEELSIHTSVSCLTSLFGKQQDFSLLVSNPRQALAVPNSKESFKAREELLILIQRANALSQLESLFDLVHM